MTWTEEKIDRLKKLWSEGMTTAAIGARLKVSKNAVVGKAHRLELKARSSPIKPQRTTNGKPKPVLKVTLADMSSRSCRWPSGDPQREDFRFCGRQVAEGKPYCTEHCGIAYVGFGKV